MDIPQSVGTETRKNGPIARTNVMGTVKIPNAAIFVKRTALEFLQILFHTREKGDYHYDEDDTKTEIQIADQHTVDLDAVNVRPAIVAIRGPVSFGNMGLGGNSVEQHDMKTGNITFNDLITGSVAFSCISREGTEAEQLAHLVANSFKYFRPVLQKLGFFSIKSLGIGSEMLVEQNGDSDDLYIVPVNVQVQMQDRWSLSKLDLNKVQKILTEFTTNP